MTAFQTGRRSTARQAWGGSGCIEIEATRRVGVRVDDVWHLPGSSVPLYNELVNACVRLSAGPLAYELDALPALLFVRNSLEQPQQLGGLKDRHDRWIA